MNDAHHLEGPVDEGDLAVFRELVKKNRHRIFRLAYDLTGNKRDAEDLSQEVFTKVYRSFDTFRGDSDAGSWLYRITINCWTDKRRRKSLPTADFNDEIIRAYPDHNPSSAEHFDSNPEHVLQMRKIQGHIEQALRKLTTKQRAIFVLRHYNGLPIKEIAKMFMISEGTVKSLLYRSLKKMQKELSFYHSDRGVHYASGEYVRTLLESGLRPSMSAKGNPYDNAKIESFIKTLKQEEVYISEYETFKEAKERIGRFIEVVYNRKRLHSALGYLPRPSLKPLTPTLTTMY